MLENSQINASRNPYSLPPLLPPHQLVVTVLGELQRGRDGTGSSLSAFPLDGNPASPGPAMASTTVLRIPEDKSIAFCLFLPS